MKYCFTLILSIVFVLYYGRSFAQTPDAAEIFMHKITQPSPEAASLGKYGEYPVSLNNGLVNISIPIYEINTGKLSLPISLNYHGGGIKVNDIASSVGLGWSLSAGGVVTRAVMGNPDEKGDGLLNNPFPPPDDPGEHFECFLAYLTMGLDGKADLFNYSAGSSNGKFMFKNVKARGTPFEIVTIPHSPIRITVSQDFTTFTIIDLDGTTYTFGQPERTVVMTDGSQDFDAPTSWYLTSMESADKSESITFTYTPETNIMTAQVSNAFTVQDGVTYLPGRVTNSVSQSISRHYGVNVEEIRFKNGKLRFEYMADREDINDARRLDKIRLYKETSPGQYAEIKRFVLGNQSYFIEAYGQTSHVGLITSINHDKRLKLTSVTEQGIVDDAVIGNPPYTFDYNEGPFPRYSSTAQDFMGFYNGAHGNDNLLFYGVGLRNDEYVVSTDFGADRKIDPNRLKAGVLERITYPTGGYTIFESEPNQRKFTETVNEPMYDSYRMSVTSHIPEEPEYLVTVTSEMTGGEDFVLADFRITGVNNIDGEPQINTVLRLWDETLGEHARFALFPYMGGAAYYPVNSGSDPFPAARKVRLELGHTYKLYYDGPQYIPETMNFFYGFVDWKIQTGVRTYDVERTEYTGGLRIKSITSHDGYGNVTRKKYEYLDSYYNTYLFTGDPAQVADKYKRSSERFPIVTSSQAPRVRIDVYGENYTFPMGSLNTVASYSRVEEYVVGKDDNPLGKTVYKYKTAVDYIPSLAPDFRSDEEWLRRQLENVSTYRIDQDGEPIKIKEVVNEYDYNVYDWVTSYASALSVEGHPNGIGIATYKECMEDIDDQYQYGSFDQVIYSSNLIRTTTTEFADDGETSTMTTVTDYTYDDEKHFQLTKTQRQTSAGESRTVGMKYPLDYEVSSCDVHACYSTYNAEMDALLALKTDCESIHYSAYRSTKSETDFANYIACGSSFQSQVQALVANFNTCKDQYLSCIDAVLPTLTTDQQAILIMQRDNVVNVPMETTSGYILDNSEYITDAYRKDFRPVNNGATALDVLWRFNSQLPILKSDYSARSESYLRKVGKISKYNSSNNVIEKEKDQDVISSFIWDYRNQFPVAEILNASYDDVAYTSFEADGSGNFNISSPFRYGDARTGEKCYDLSNGAVSKAGLAPGIRYRVSLWAKSGTVICNGKTLSPESDETINGWSFYQDEIIGSETLKSVTVSGSALIDELRLYPVFAQMNTYTYDPLKGITSETDNNNQTTFFVYDAMGRLKSVRDSQGNMVKDIVYYYKQ